MDLSACVFNELYYSRVDTDSRLTMTCKGKRIHVELHEANLVSSPTILSQYLHYLEVARACELDGLTVEDFYDWILAACQPAISTLPPFDGSTNPTLRDYLSLETLHYEMHVVDNKLVALRQSDEEKWYTRPRLGVQLSDEICSDWTITAPEDVYICASSAQEAISRKPRKVRVKSEEYYLKLFGPGDYTVCKREIQTYKEIKNAGLESLRISYLYGLMRDDAAGTVLGLLLRHIDAELVTLACAARHPETPYELRKQWAAQVSETVSRLHGAGIVWGDVKPENVLIDVEQNAWVIDFGGGYTEDCVDKELAETMEGDHQGLENLLKFISTAADSAKPDVDISS